MVPYDLASYIPIIKRIWQFCLISISEHKSRFSATNCQPIPDSDNFEQHSSEHSKSITLSTKENLLIKGANSEIMELCRHGWLGMGVPY